MAETGVRRSKMRMWLSEETAETMAGLVGEKEALYVQLPTGKVVSEAFRVGDHCDRSR